MRDSELFAVLNARIERAQHTQHDHLLRILSDTRADGHKGSDLIAEFARRTLDAPVEQVVDVLVEMNVF